MKKLNLLFFLLVIIACSCSKDDEFSGKSGTFTDARDGQVYKWVKIGDQIWMAENLKTIYFSNGDSIPNMTNRTEFKTLTTPAYCWYEYDEPMYSYPYGALYNGYAIITSNIAPKGWHIPSEDEWQTLVDYLGGIGIAGGKLKETGTIHWKEPNELATNESGFTAVPGGLVASDGTYPVFYSIGYRASFWNTTIKIVGTGFEFLGACRLANDMTGIEIVHEYKYYGLSVRCIKD